jgi:hypothetical protein
MPLCLTEVVLSQEVSIVEYAKLKKIKGKIEVLGIIS